MAESAKQAAHQQSAMGATRLRGRKLLAALRRIPFTLGLLGVLILCAVLINLFGEIRGHSAFLQRGGYGLSALREGRIWTLLTGIFLAVYPWLVAGNLWLIALFVGGYEARAGSKRAALVFFATQIGGALLTAVAIVWPLTATGWPWAQHLEQASDLGASVGALGCAAALTAGFARQWRVTARTVLFGALAALLLITHRIWDIEHLLAAVLGVGFGHLLQTPEERQGLAARDATERRLTWQRPFFLNTRRGRTRAALAITIALVGLINVISTLVTRTEGRFARWPELIPFGLMQGTRLFVLAAGFGLLLLTRGLWYGRRVAWLAALLLLLGSAISHVGKGFNLGSALLQLVLAVALALNGREFRARPETPTVNGTLRLFGLALLGLCAYGTAGFLLLRHTFRPSPTWDQFLREFAARLVLDSTGLFNGPNFRERWFLDSLSFLWLTILFVTILALLRPALRAAPESPRDRERAGGLLRGWGDAYVAYRVVNGVALALGDPIGEAAACERAIEEFLDLCATRGWVPCFYATTPRFLATYTEVGLRNLQIAEDTVIDLADLDFKGRAWQDVRTALNKAEREGIRYESYDDGAVPAAIQAQLRAISDAWTAEKELPEMGFTLGTLDEVPDPQVRTAVALDATGVVQGFTTWLPIYQGGAIIGWTIDLMRRRPEGFRNVMEFLIARSAGAMRIEGFQWISLSSAPLARIAREGQETGPLQQLLDLLADRLEPFYGFRSLFAFKQKFRPRWEPVYLIFPSVATLPQLSVAIVRAYLPDLGLREVA